MVQTPTKAVAPSLEEDVADAESPASIGAQRFDWGFKGATVSKLIMLGYFLDEDSPSSAKFNAIIDLLVNAGARNHRRILAYLRDLTENLANDPQADPRVYARRVLRGNDEPT